MPSVLRHIVGLGFIFFIIQNSAVAQGNYFHINDIDMYYEIQGEGSPFLFLHGGTRSFGDFKNQTLYFSKKYKLILPECRGHNRTSDSEAPITYRLMTSDIVGLLDHLGLDSVFVVGWSDGGIIGMHLASLYPKKVKKLVTISPNYHPSGIKENMSAAVKRMKGQGEDSLFIEKMKNMWLTLPDFKQEELANIKSPTLIVAGDHDVLKLDHIVSLYNIIPKAQLCILPGTGHNVLYRRPKLITQIIDEFFEQNKK